MILPLFHIKHLCSVRAAYMFSFTLLNHACFEAVRLQILMWTIYSLTSITDFTSRNLFKAVSSLRPKSSNILSVYVPVFIIQGLVHQDLNTSQLTHKTMLGMAQELEEAAQNLDSSVLSVK